jgi:hypothetical protein
VLDSDAEDGIIEGQPCLVDEFRATIAPGLKLGAFGKKGTSVDGAMLRVVRDESAGG